MAMIEFTDKLPTIDKIKELLIREALKRSKGDPAAAAKMLGVSVNALGRWMRQPETLARGIVLIFFILLAGFRMDASAADAYVDGQVVVNFRPQVDAAAVAKIIADYHMRIHEKIEQIGYYVLILPPGASVTEMVETLRQHPQVLNCEPNYTADTMDVANDRLFDTQWSLDNNDQEGVDLHVTEAWEIETGNPDVLVAVIDMGFDFSHEDLQANIWHNPGEIAGNGIDDDNNGYIDDIVGWDFVDQPSGLEDPENDYRTEDNDPTCMLSSHGNRVVGLIGATTGNGIGIAGIAGNCRFMLIRAGYLNEQGTAVLSSSHIARGVIYAADNGARVINISSGSSRYSKSYYAALHYAIEKGAVIVCSAGNESSEKPVYPAAYDLPGLLSVGASDRGDNPCWFSNYGSWVDVSAPGENIVTTFLRNRYDETRGTSFAAPMVAAVVALVVSHYPDWTPAQVQDRIMNSVDTVESLHGANITSGRVNARRALEMGDVVFEDGADRQAASAEDGPVENDTSTNSVTAAESGGCFVTAGVETTVPVAFRLLVAGFYLIVVALGASIKR